MTEIIDRRLNGKDKSIGNRERFKRRVDPIIKEQIQRKLGDLGITDLKKVDKQDIHVPKRGIEEPVFGHQQQGGTREIVHPGNKEYIKGDRIPKPQGGGQGGGGSQASEDGEGQDDFVFSLTKEEFLNYLFDDMELMNLLRNDSDDIKEFVSKRAGFSSDGSPNNLHIVRSLRQSFMRKVPIAATIQTKIALLDQAAALLSDPNETVPDAARTKEIERFVDDLRKGGYDKGGHNSDQADAARDTFPDVMQRVISVLAARAAGEKTQTDLYQTLISDINAERKRQTERYEKILYLDPIDLRYRNRTQRAVPTSRATMIMLMDVSGSMDEERKKLAKLFCLFTLLFLEKNYEKVETVFVRHHTEAEECNEHDFFNKPDTGGTKVSSGLRVVSDIMKSRYSGPNNNVYLVQLSDGDNWGNDTPLACDILRNEILPNVRHASYLQVAADIQDLWRAYQDIKSEYPSRFAVEMATKQSEVYPALKRIFQKRKDFHGHIPSPSP